MTTDNPNFSIQNKKLTGSERKKVKDFGPLQKHIKTCNESFPDQTIEVQGVHYQSGQIMALNAISYFKNEDGSSGAYNYTIAPDFKTDIYLFKIAAKETTDYFVLSSLKPRPSMAHKAFQGATSATLVRENETLETAGQRKLEAETNKLAMPQPSVSIEAMRDQPITYSTTMRGNVDVHLVELDMTEKQHQAFWDAAQGRKGGDKSYGECTELAFVEVGAFLTKGTTLPIRDGILTAAIRLMDREPQLIHAVQRGLQPSL